MCDINSFLKNVDSISQKIKARDAVYVSPNQLKDSEDDSLEESAITVKPLPNDDLSLDPVEVSRKNRILQLEKIIKTRTDFLHTVFQDFSKDTEKKIQMLSTFVGDLADGRWDEKGSPVEYFENVSSLSEMARDLGRLKKAVEDLSEARDELKEISK